MFSVIKTKIYEVDINFKIGLPNSGKRASSQGKINRLE